MLSRRNIVGGVLVGGLGVGPALAQGPGVRAGDLVIHPRAQVGVGYDDNVFLESDDDPTAPPNDSPVLKVGGGLSLANRSPNKLALELDGDFRYQNFFAPNTDAANEDDSDRVKRRIEDRNGIEFGRVQLTVGLLPRSPVSLDLKEDMRFTDRASFETSEGELVPEGVFERLENSVGADVRFHPGPPEGRVFESRLGYRFHTIGFLGDDSRVTEQAEKTAHEARFLTTWRFLPKTAAEAEFKLAANDYNTVSLDPQDPDAAVGPDRDSRPFYAILGLRGLITNRVSTVLRAGYGNTFNAEGESFSGPVGQAEIEYKLEPTLTTALGYERAGRDTSFSNFVVSDRVYAKAMLAFARVWELGGNVGYGRYDFSEANTIEGADDRVDPILTAGAQLTFHMRDYVTLAATWQFEKNDTDFELPGGTEQFAYTRNVVLLSVNADY